jgi:hypothetical protein
MKDCEKRHAHSKRRRCATPPVSGRLRLCLTIFGHQGDSISTLTKSKSRGSTSKPAVVLRAGRHRCSGSRFGCIVQSQVKSHSREKMASG